MHKCVLVGYSRHKKKTTFIGGMELASLRCNRNFTSASSYGLGWYKYAIATQWYQFHTTDAWWFSLRNTLWYIIFRPQKQYLYWCVLAWPKDVAYTPAIHHPDILSTRWLMAIVQLSPTCILSCSEKYDKYIVFPEIQHVFHLVQKSMTSTYYFPKYKVNKKLTHWSYRTSDDTLKCISSNANVWTWN